MSTLERNNIPSVFQKSNARPVTRLLSTVSAVALAIATTVPAGAGGSNTSDPNTPPVTPTPLITSVPQLDTVGQGGCAWQYTQAINKLGADGLIASGIGLGLQGVGAAADVVGLTASAASASASAATFGVWAFGLSLAAFGDPLLLAAPGLGVASGAAGTMAGTSTADAIALGAQIAGAVTSVGGLATSITGQVLATEQGQLNTYVSETLPLCDTVFTGTVAVTGGGIDVTGDSIFQNNLGVVGDVDVGGNVTASQVHATQGISAMGGKITLGDLDGIHYSDGITIGGGAVSGAGFGGAMAFTGDVTAIAIGNGAGAENANDTALGTGAQAAGGGATAVGAGASASEMGAIAIGDASATNTDAIAVGTGASASGVGSIAIGQGATATGSIAMGTLSTASNGGAAYGDNSTATGANSTAVGPSTTATPDGSAAFGYGAVALLADQQVFGTSSNTYLWPGITSNRSRSRQSGPLELMTTDSAGNLGSDQGDAFKAIARLQAGVAIALAAEAPSLTSSENFGLRVGWGNFQGDGNAAAVSAIGVVCRSCLTLGDRVAIDASIGAGWSDYKTYNPGNVVGGRAGVQWTW